MGLHTGQLPQLPSPGTWQAEAGQLLEEHHLSAWSHHAVQRRRFVESLATSLKRIGDTQVCLLPGDAITDIFSFCNYLERALGRARVRRSIDARHGVVDSLRRVSDAQPVKRRYIIWQDADALLRADHALFGRLADAMMGVSAELEYASEDLLVIQRVIFVGAPSLDMYAEDARGQFRRWFAERGEEPLWTTISGVKHPPVLRYRIDQVMDDEVQSLIPSLISRPGGRRPRATR